MKKIRENSFEEKFFQKLLQSEDLKREKDDVGAFFKKPIWWTVRSLNKKPPRFKETSLAKCEMCAKSTKRKGECLKKLRRALQNSKKTKHFQRFTCKEGFEGLCFPIMQADKIYAYIGLCHFKEAIPQKVVVLFIDFLNLLAKNIQKELELSTLYETIRPRAIALSTVHTIHRLINSTLDMDELLPRIARLCMQVMQANRCSVKLLDRERGVLKPVTTIDLRTKRRLYPKELKLGKGVPGKAAKEGRVIKGRSFLAIPLIDEDVIGVITIYDKINNKAFVKFDQEIMMTIAEQAVIAIKNAQLYREQENLAISGIKSLATILDTRESSAFIPRSAFVKMVITTGKDIGLSETELRGLHAAALLHDAGQIFVPDEILSKPTKLTGEEYNLIKEHPAKGAKILEPTKYLKPVIPIILHHHENYDGTGYPNKLKGNQIPLGARIMAVISAFLAMITPRSYRITKTVEEAKQEIIRNSGTQFDPKVVTVFLKVLNKKEILCLLEKEHTHGLEQTLKGSDIF